MGFVLLLFLGKHMDISDSNIKWLLSDLILSAHRASVQSLISYRGHFDMFQFVSEQIALPLLVRHETSLLPLPVVCVYLCCGRGVGHAPLSPQAKNQQRKWVERSCPIHLLLT